MKYPRLWEHKTTKMKVKVLPWWEIIKDNGEIEEVDDLGRMVSEATGTTSKFGILTQIGYLLESEEGMWYGVNKTVLESFHDCGEWNEKRSGAV